MMPRVREVTSKAWKMGIKIVAGTDTGYLPRSNRRIPDEIVEFVNVGIPAMEAIKAATSVSAQCLVWRNAWAQSARVTRRIS
jgi:imidazolonepropionase-like amidohydrolase